MLLRDDSVNTRNSLTARGRYLNYLCIFCRMGTYRGTVSHFHDSDSGTGHHFGVFGSMKESIFCIIDSGMSL